MSELIKCVNLTKSYGSKEALCSLDLTLESGKIIGLLGPNGSGKTTLIKILCGLLTPTDGYVSIDGMKIGAQTKAIVSYLPERTYIPSWMRVKHILSYFEDFYADFRRPLAEDMLTRLKVDLNQKVKTLSKGNKEKVQLVLVMSRNAKLYLLDEPIAGVDPAARDYILDTIITNYNPDASVIISTHLIQDIERILDDVVMIQYGHLKVHGSADAIRNEKGMSIDQLFREVFRC
ncbi:MAG: ABC transporter ATP-binding protein [Ruminococcus sp.]|nr:ABC transporter ATP-binding protein [Ruminococcus sp.]